MQSNAQSQVSFIGVAPGRHCGYCNSVSGSHAFFLHAHQLTVVDYQKLLDIGWRRSGRLLYRPNLKRSCCVQYTIRLDATKFKPTREHRKTLNRWSRFIQGENYIRELAIKHPRSKEEKKRRETEFDLVESVHAPEYKYLTIPPEPSKKLEVTIEKSTFTNEKYALYEHYQCNIHQEEAEEISRSGFNRFLCESPLETTEPYPTDGSKRLGSFHQLYRVDGRLVALSVLDFLPWCVSGVYFMYHTDYKDWGFGKMSACREAAMALEEGYNYYYMGFYIHSSPKMRYKGQFHPTYFLDPETLDWCLLTEKAKGEIEDKVYYCPSNPNSEWTWEGEVEGEVYVESTVPCGDVSLWESEMPGIPSICEVDAWGLGRVPIIINKTKLTADMLVSFADPDSIPRAIIREYAATVGEELAFSMRLAFS